MSQKKRILIADPSTSTIRTIFGSDKAEKYEILTAGSATECLSHVTQFKPHLVFTELLLPEMHGLEVLKKIKAHKESATTGVVIATSLTMIQNYNAAKDLGAAFFLVKPFDPDKFFDIVERYFEGMLEFDPFSTKLPHYGDDACYNPTKSSAGAYLKFWGTRGSISVAGPQYVTYGGNTSCVELHFRDEVIILDAGTGIRDLGERFDTGKYKNINLILGHTHWDHITGFPFFAPVYNKDVHLDIWAPVGYEKSTGELFDDMLSFGYFPIRLEEVYATIEFNDLRDGSVMKFGDIEISCHHAKHPGSTLCFKIRTPRTTIGYVSDNEVLLGYHGHPSSIGMDHFLLEPHLSLIEFLSDCHTVIHEAQYFPQEYHEKVGWGHSSISNVAAIIQHLDCKEWIITHHDPKHTDSILQEKTLVTQDILNDCNINTFMRMAYDGLTIPL
jgi:ribonuclease BN (tRNA processing enzyme)/ActR/RegA family two-component response regulator